VEEAPKREFLERGHVVIGVHAPAVGLHAVEWFRRYLTL
jgi:hypothetical protein